MTQDFAALVTGGLNLGAFAVLMWLVRHTFKFTIPRLAKDFNDALSETRESCKEELREQRIQFIKELHFERDSFNEQLSTQREQFREELHAERTCLGQKIDRLKDSVDDMLKGK